MLNEKELKANAEEYVRWRSKKLGASEVPAVMGLSPYETPYGLWLKKTGRSTNEWKTNIAIERGNKFEGTARALFEMKSDLDFPATIKVCEKYNFLHASLDGFNEETQTVLEIKCVTGDKVFDDALDGKVSDHYYDQVQQQIYVSQAVKAYFFVCKLDTIHGEVFVKHSQVVEVMPDLERQTEILKKCLWFWNLVQADIAPPLCSKDVLESADVDLVELTAKAKTFNTKEAFKKEFINLVEAKQLHTNIKCNNWKLQKQSRGWVLSEVK